MVPYLKQFTFIIQKFYLRNYDLFNFAKIYAILFINQIQTIWSIIAKHNGKNNWWILAEIYPSSILYKHNMALNSVGLILIHVADVWNKLKVSNFLSSFKLRSGTWKPDFQDDKIFCRDLIWSQMAGFWYFPSEMWWWMVGRILLLVTTLVKCWNILF